MKYPVESPQDWQRVGRLSPARSIAVAWRDLRFRRRARHLSPVDLRPLRVQANALGEDELVLLCVVRDAAKYIPSFLAHYRRIGVGRFAFVNDRSEDATGAMLAAEPDVDLFESSADFRRSAGGLMWRDLLVNRYGRNRWYVSVDCDEYLIFPGCEDRSLSAFVADVRSQGAKRALAVMIDVYPDGEIGSVPTSTASLAFPTELCPLYDGADYRMAEEKFCTSIRGGPRHRLFGADMRLTKFPLLYADAATQFAGGSHHGPLPIRRNFAPVRAVLVHYKFPAGAVQDFRTIAERGSHFGDSLFYRQIVTNEGFGEQADFRYRHSVRFAGSQKLVDDGFMQDIRTG